MSASDLAKLVGAEENFRLLLDAAPDAVVVTKRDGRIVLVNTQTETLFGYQRQELLGHKVELLLPRRFRQRHVQHRAAYVSHPSVRTMGSGLELCGRRKDGTEFPIDVSLSSLETAEELLISSFIRDATERRHSEELLAHLAAMVHASDDAIIGKSLDGIISSWNPGAERLYGYKAEEVIGKPLTLLVPRDRTYEYAEIMRRLRQGKHIERYETRRLHKDGHQIEVCVTISPVRDRAGALMGASVVARDITRQKRLEQALRQNEERFRVALKNAPVAVFNHDTNLRYIWINSALLVWGQQDYLGRTDAEIVGGEEGARLTAIKQEVLRTGFGTRTETELTFQGETYYFDLVVEPLRDVRGQIIGLTCAATDLTSAKKNLLERERLIAKLQEALEEVKLLSGLLSICASCKKITNERGAWEPLESYLQTHSEATFSHGLCPDCLRKLYPEQFREWDQKTKAEAARRGPKHASDTTGAQSGDDQSRKSG